MSKKGDLDRFAERKVKVGYSEGYVMVLLGDPKVFLRNVFERFLRRNSSGGSL